GAFAPRRYPNGVPAAVLFDWGDTLIRFAYDEALVEAGHRAGLAALRRSDLPEVERVAEHFRDRYEPLFWAPGTVEELEYPGLVRQLLGDFGVDVGDRLYEDVRGSAELGMTTVQALWFRADEHPEGGEPDFQAFTQMDVLNVVGRLDTASV